MACARQLRAVLPRGHFSAQVIHPAAVVAAGWAGPVPQVIVFDLAEPTLDGLALWSRHSRFAMLMLHQQGNLDDVLDGTKRGPMRIWLAAWAITSCSSA
jgi:hypothetical protein